MVYLRCQRSTTPACTCPLSPLYGSTIGGRHLPLPAVLEAHAEYLPVRGLKHIYAFKNVEYAQGISYIKFGYWYLSQ